MGLCTHVGHAAVESLAAEGRRDVFDQSAALVVTDPILEVVQARIKAPGAASAAVAVDLDEAQHFLRRVGRRMEGDEAAHGEGDFEKCPTIHPIHVDGRRLDAVVEFEGVVHVGGPLQGEGELVDPLAERQLSPAGAVTAVHQLLKLFLTDEGLLQRQAGGQTGAGGSEEQGQAEEECAHGRAK